MLYLRLRAFRLSSDLGLSIPTVRTGRFGISIVLREAQLLIVIDLRVVTRLTIAILTTALLLELS